ncbi:MAG: hypothetical protein QGD94_09750, partial [Planctomycetia bacterium]|nr:hypothetical protein [Planctomycetia bacterium]
GGIDILRYPERLDCLLRAGIPLKHAITARLRTAAVWNVLHPDEPMQAAIQLTSAADRDINAKVKMTLLDFWEKTIEEKTFAAKLPSMGKFTREYKIPDGLRGHFVVKWEIDCGDGKTVRKESSFVIVPRRKPGFKDPAECYFSVYHWHTMNEMFARLGVGMQGMEVTGSWKVPDVAEAYDRLTFSKGRSLGFTYSIYPWRDENNNTRAPKDMKAFGRFVYGVTDYFSKKGITYFGTWNEPQFWFHGSRRQLAQMMRETYMNIKSANPKATVLGPGLLGNMSYNRKMFRAVKKLCEEEGLEEHFPFFDIYGIHYGSFPFETEYVKYIRRHRALMDEFGLPKDMTIMNGEMTIPSGHMNNRATHDPRRYWYNAAKYWLRQCLVGFPEGVRQNCIFFMGAICRGTGSIDTNNLNAANYEATQLYASVATAADELETTRYEKKLDLGENIWGLQFRRKDGGRTLVLWTFEDTSKSPWANRVVKVKVPVKSERVAHIDIMGVRRMVDTKGGVVEIEVDGYPSYIEDPPRKMK